MEWISNKFWIIIQHILWYGRIVGRDLEITRCPEPWRHQLIKHIFIVCRMTRANYAVRIQGIQYCIRVTRASVPYLMRYSPAPHVPYSVIFEGQLYTAFIPKPIYS